MKKRRLAEDLESLSYFVKTPCLWPAIKAGHLRPGLPVTLRFEPIAAQ